jgi:hypothetical protein
LIAQLRTGCQVIAALIWLGKAVTKSWQLEMEWLLLLA